MACAGVFSDCTPSHCSSNCYSDVCSIDAPACPANTYSFGATVLATDTILATHVNDLQDAIDDERFTRRSLARDFTGQNVVADVDIVTGEGGGGAEDYGDLKDSINEIISNYTARYNPGEASPVSTITDTYLTSQLITAAKVNSLRATINTLRQDCACDSDCGANAICGCDGNCNCHNYCGCNYSDRRLKKEIKYL